MVPILVPDCSLCLLTFELFQFQVFAQGPLSIHPQSGPQVLGDCEGSLQPDIKLNLPLRHFEHPWICFKIIVHSLAARWS